MIRLTLSGLVLLPFFYRYIKGTSKIIWGWCLLLGLSAFFIPHLSFAFAQTVISSSLAGMLNSLQPLFTLVVGIFLFKHHIPRHQVFGVLIGFAGAIILLGAKSSVASYTDNFLFSLLVVLATFCYGIAANIIRLHLKDVSPLKITTLSLGIFIIPCSLILFNTDVISRIGPEPQIIKALYSLAILAIFGTSISVILYNKLIKEGGMMMASTVAYLIPVVAIIWGIFDGELINLAHLIGICVIFTGLYLINQRQGK